MHTAYKSAYFNKIKEIENSILLEKERKWDLIL